MTSPLQGGRPDDSRGSTTAKILWIADLLMKIGEALLGIFGRRKEDPKL